MNKEKKYRKNMKCLDQWLTAYERGNYISDYLKLYQIKNIGIYGYGMLGKHLVFELRRKNFPIYWVMDRVASGDENHDQIVRPDDWKNLQDVDMAVITTMIDVEEIEMFLMQFISGKILSVEELIGNMYRWGSQR